MSNDIRSKIIRYRKQEAPNENIEKLKDYKVNRKIIYSTRTDIMIHEACLTGLDTGVLAMQGLQLWKIRYAVRFGEILGDLSKNGQRIFNKP